MKTFLILWGAFEMGASAALGREVAVIVYGIGLGFLLLTDWVIKRYGNGKISARIGH